MQCIPIIHISFVTHPESILYPCFSYFVFSVVIIFTKYNYTLCYVPTHWKIVELPRGHTLKPRILLFMW